MKKCQSSSLRRFTNRYQYRYPLSLAALVLIISSASSCNAATGEELVAAFEQMQTPSLSSERVLVISDYTIEHHDFSLNLESGMLYLYDPIPIDSESREWGGLFVGKAEFNFKPTVPMEVEQLRKYYELDSLAISVNEVELIFGQQLIEPLINSSDFRRSQITDRLNKSVEEQHQYLTDKKQIAPLFAALKGNAFPGGRPFLLVNTALGKIGQTIYTFDPYAREEISLQLHRWNWGSRKVMEIVSSYSQYSNGSLATINGMAKNQLLLANYDLIVSIDEDGAVSYEATLDATVTMPTQLVKLDLNHDLKVSSVDLVGYGPVKFKRYSENIFQQTGLWLYFDRQLIAGDTIRLTVKYEGELLNQTQVGFGAIVEGNWYPKYNSQAATFDMSFSTAKKRKLAVSGRLLSSQVKNYRRFTSWSQTEPAAELSYSLTTSFKYELAEEKAVPIEVLYDPRIHVEYMYDHEEHKTIAEDLANTIKLYEHHFGPYQFTKLRATELLDRSDKSFPGLLHLGFITTDEKGRRENDRFIRARETARQWWGNVADYTSYHDAWLAESFAEYSALMYLQATAGNRPFMRQLGSYRDQIFLDEKLTSTNRVSGSILLGHRSASAAVAGDDKLVYKKGAFVLHMLRNLLLDLKSMSDDRFQAMMREWYRTYKDQEATTHDFKRLVDKHVGEDMDWFFDQFIIGTDLPTYQFSYETELLPDGHTAINCHLEQTGVPAGFKMYVPVEIKLATGSKIYMRLLVDQLVGDIELPLVQGVVKSVILNPFNSVLCKVENR